jgi:hypothetical protein
MIRCDWISPNVGAGSLPIMRTVWAAVTAAVFASGCVPSTHSQTAGAPNAGGDLTGDPLEDVALRTDRLRYHFKDQHFEIVAVYTNPSARTIYLYRCGREPAALSVEQRVDDAWVEVMPWDCPALGWPEPYALAPGETFTDTLRLFHPGSGTGFFRPRYLPGEFRLVIEAFERWDTGDPGARVPLPKVARTSNSFVIER